MNSCTSRWYGSVPMRLGFDVTQGKKSKEAETKAFYRKVNARDVANRPEGVPLSCNLCSSRRVNSTSDSVTIYTNPCIANNLNAIQLPSS